MGLPFDDNGKSEENFIVLVSPTLYKNSTKLLNAPTDHMTWIFLLLIPFNLTFSGEKPREVGHLPKTTRVKCGRAGNKSRLSDTKAYSELYELD